VTRFLRLSLHLYRTFLGIYPAPLRHHFGDEMVEVFEQQLLAAWGKCGAAGVAGVWYCVLAELAIEAASRDCRRLGIPLASMVTSFGLFLAFLWAAGLADSCR